MKNLKRYLELAFELPLRSSDETILFSAFDVEQYRLFFASSANLVYSLRFPSTRRGEPWSESLLPSGGELIAVEDGDSITAFDYLMEKEALVLGTSNGYLLLHTVDGNVTEVVGRVEGGVKCISPSPDGALLAIASGFGQLLVMTHDWEVMYENSLQIPELDKNDLYDMDSTSDQFESSISWRGDGKYFGTLSGVNDVSHPQKIIIWERDSGSLHATSESKAFMPNSLDWMPSGAKVAVACDRKAEKKCPSIVFFEKNGLERSSFSIDESMLTKVESLKWNCSSDLVAAVVTCSGYDAIKIWSFSNNHWYLKQEIRYSKEDRVKFLWDPTKPLHLVTWTVGGKVMSYSFVWMTAVTDTSTALVIDNSSILVTPLDLSLIPPPMSLFNLRFRCAVHDVAFFSKNSKNQLAACLCDGSLCVVELPATDSWEQLEGKEVSIESLDFDVYLGTLSHLTWLDSHVLLGVSPHNLQVNGLSHQDLMEQGPGYFMHEIELTCSENTVPGLVTSSGWHAKISRSLPLEAPLIGVVPNPAKKHSAIIQYDGGSVFEYSSNVDAPRYFHKLDLNTGFSSSCPWLKVVTVDDHGIPGTLVIGLDDNGRLYAGGRILSNNCSSFSLYSNACGSVQEAVTHLILTTRQDLLFIISTNDLLLGKVDLQIENCTPGHIHRKGEANREYINIWERGAKVVGVVHGDEAAVILQTNRGNLECIYPRKLVLVSIINALLQGRFKDAMLMVRRHRIDFNIMVDYCGWQAFLQSATEFISQIDNLGHITEFVCSIKNENVMESLYKNIMTLPCPLDTSPMHLNEVNDLGSLGKVSSVLLAIRKALQDHVQESPARELCILTTLARSEPPALEEALKRIKVIRELELAKTDDCMIKSYPSAEEALKHLLWLSDTGAVYETALGLYDLNLAAIVALNSQKDPKEFLPFLRELEKLSPVIMQYTIDLRLRRYESALKHIASAGEAYEEDCRNLIKTKPHLFPLALQLFNDPGKRNQVLEDWGDHLHGEKCFEDAATTYLCCSSLQKALKAYRDGGYWRGVLTVAGLLEFGTDDVLQLANELCEELQALGKPAEAAKIALDYCGDIASSVGYYVIACEWEEALRISYMHKREDLVSEVKNAATECANARVSEYEEGLEKVGKYVARYLAVRQRRLALAAKLKLEERSINDIDDDTVSEASSSFSGMSAYTMGTVKGSGTSISSRTTGKARDMRRQKHRGGKIRAGSPGEEMALVEHLKGMSLTETSLRELKSLVLILVMLGKEETARQLQRVGDSLQLWQHAAVNLAEDTVSSDFVDEKAHTLENYVRKLNGESPDRPALSRVLVLA
ncbi:Elongator complex protein 1 [Acorus calamus]|uniref:Elongator complex protein 1 n=1 Tax=Acorus calamus TaxID=4465 RepID=A0AAV9C7D0_ACOCL|nr:Elongator complex protein 1 [Acorus calamus]